MSCVGTALTIGGIQSRDVRVWFNSSEVKVRRSKKKTLVKTDHGGLDEELQLQNRDWRLDERGYVFVRHARTLETLRPLPWCASGAYWPYPTASSYQ